MDRIAIIGTAGLLGQYLLEEAYALNLDILSTYHTNRPTHAKGRLEHLDITYEEGVQTILKDYRPEVVFLPSALTNVDYCELHPQEAWDTNVKGTRNVASACKEIGARLVYISTDYVFDGVNGKCYNESDVPNPPNVYANTKLEGERQTLDMNHLNCVARVCVLYGWNRASEKNNFVTWVVNNLRQGKEVTLFGDQYVSPTYAPHVAKVLLTMASNNAAGIYHTAGPDCLSRYDMGLKIAEVFDLNPDLCRNVRTEDVPLPARRAKNSCLDIQKVETELNIQMTPFATGLNLMRAEE